MISMRETLEVRLKMDGKKGKNVVEKKLSPNLHSDDSVGPRQLNHWQIISSFLSHGSRIGLSLISFLNSSRFQWLVTGLAFLLCHEEYFAVSIRESDVRRGDKRPRIGTGEKAIKCRSLLLHMRPLDRIPLAWSLLGIDRDAKEIAKICEKMLHILLRHSWYVQEEKLL